ncbi:DNA polymerase III subunit alpha [Cohnella sp. CIP 111063]|uniref:DNA polymerase III subunit alpha n=1 Tax=unclassified Cohnella TaxID=2636738 RepID=UPI000B8C3621|nr:MULTISPECIES: DNA polymerase III subunit alpha [unclassified Cohnella]OXS53224.1 DNA polymerase III subunit alpha [Cohnella sp. CIP 111063]PRX60991.1 DNA polymerase-3 subunit alpha [Cohnella sp. SGD-V74]
MCDFVHLHVHSEYSLLDGAARIKEMAAKAAELGMTSLALTDHGVMYGAVPFYKACLERGIKPIIGMEAYITAGSRHDKQSRKEQPTYHLTLLAKNETGYRNLMKLTTIGHLEGFYYRPRIDFEALSAHAEGVICLSGCMSSELSKRLEADDYDAAKELALRYRALFGENYYLEIQDHGILEQKKITVGVIRLSEELGIPLVATNDSHYICEEDHSLQDVLLCIGTGKTMDDPERFKIATDQLYMKSGEEMSALFRHVPEALANTVRIAESCTLELEFGRHILPEFAPLPEGKTAGRYLAELCDRGLRARYEGTSEWADAAFRAAAEERLGYELRVIGEMGFDDYFLVVWDFIRFAHENGIVTGPGRGSAAGSLVAYALNITDVDPLRHKLLFERFLNPERVTMPDIDIDFSDERRDEVIRYVVEKYGAEHVAQIITFGTLAARAAVRDVGRVMNLPYGDVDKAAKLIPGMPGMSIERAMRESSEFKALAEGAGEASRLIAMARRVEGMPRHASTHAAGVVISSDPLTDYVPLQEGTGGVPLTQYSMEHLEAVGLLKMDFLGLRTLSIIERSLASIREQTGRELRWQDVPYDDPATYELMGRGETTGIFQLESTGMRRVLKEMKPSSFEDIVSAVALYRPGPMEFIPQFIRAKHGLVEVEYPHPNLKEILADTYGIIVYQEQIMQIASVMAGFSLGQADLLRRAVGKKKREVLDEQRKHFVAGSLKLGYSEQEANGVYDLIVRFADYGFCRAHAAAYAVLAFQTAYLKAHYPVAFMASMLTAVVGNQRKTAEYVDECRRMGIAVLKPDVNESGVLFTPVAFGEGGGAIRFGLAGVKNVGTQAIESIMRERGERPYESLSDFCRRVDPRACNKRVIESLVQAGALESMPGHRAQQLAALEPTVAAAALWRKEREELQIELFDFEETPNWNVELPAVPAYSQTQMLELERDLMGLYLSGHPLDAYDELMEELKVERLVDIAELPDGATAFTAGMIVSMKPFVTRKGQAMAFLEIEDRIMGTELVAFPSAWAKASSFVKKGSLVFVRAKVQHGDEDYKLLADDILPLDADDLKAQAERLRRLSSGGRSGGAGGGGYSGRGGDRAAPAGAAASKPASGTAASSARARAVSEAAPAPAAAASAALEQQRVYILIDAEHEKPATLIRLKLLLKAHPGKLPTILRYEKDRRTVALSDEYYVDPKPALVEELEQLLGKDRVRVK